MADVKELVNLFNQMRDVHHQLAHAIKVVDAHLPAAHSREAEGAERLMDINDPRDVSARMLADMYHLSDLPRTAQMVICCSADTGYLIEELNTLKTRFKDYVQIIKAMHEIPVKTVTDNFCRNPHVASQLSEAGLATIDLQKIYRQVKVCIDVVPDAVSYSWSKGGRGTCKLKPKDVVTLINESGLDADQKAMYQEKLSRSIGSGVSFFKSRPLSMHQVMNLRFPGEKKWQMHRCGLPLFLVGEKLPSIQFRSRSDAEKSTGRIRRSDNKFSDSTLLLPGLRVYMRMEDSRAR